MAKGHVVRVRQIKNFSKKFHREWAGSVRAYMCIGWETWFDNDLEKLCKSRKGLRKGQTIFPRGNMHGINFPADHFEVIEVLEFDA